VGREREKMGNLSQLKSQGEQNGRDLGMDLNLRIFHGKDMGWAGIDTSLAQNTFSIRNRL